MSSGKPPFGKSDWLSMICADPGVSSLQFRVAYSVSSLFRADGSFKARLLEIAARSGATVSSVRTALFRLAERGYISMRTERHHVVVSVPAALPRRALEPGRDGFA